MEAKRIEVVKDWPESKSVRNIQVFLGFTNFYWRFIQGFGRIVALLTSMLKRIGSPGKPAPNRNNSSRSVSNKNIDNRLASEKKDGNNKVNGFDVGGNGIKHAKKLRKLSKLGKSKSEKTSKSRNLAKSGKKLSKSGNSTNFDAAEN